MHKLVKWIEKQKPNEVYYNQLARFMYAINFFSIWLELMSCFRYYFYIDGSKLPTSILTIFAHIVSVSKDHKSALIELLAKDSKYNQNEIYLTKILELWESELEWIKNKRSSDKINLIKAITNISEQGGRFDENTWQIIGNLFILNCNKFYLENHWLENEKEVALDWLASLIQNSKLCVTDKTIAKMWEIINGVEYWTFTTKLSAFKCIAFSIIEKFQNFPINIQNAFIVVIDENNVKMIELVLLCLLNCNYADIPYKIIIYLSKINTTNDQQLKNLLKVMENYIKSNDSVPKELLHRLISEGSKNQDEDIRSTSLKLLELYKESCQDIPKEITEYLEFEEKLKLLNTLTDHKEIKNILKSLLKTDFNSTLYTVWFMNTILKLLSYGNNQEYVDYIIEFISKLNENNVKLTHEFIDEIMSQYKRFKTKEEYIQLIKVFINKYDQYYNPDVMEYSLKALSKSSENIQNLWLDIILNLSTRNIGFDEVYLIKLLQLTKPQNEDIVFKVIYNSVEKLKEINSYFILWVSNYFNLNKYQSNIWRVLVEITKKSSEVSNKLIDNLMIYFQKNSGVSELVFEVFMNLNIKRYLLPEKARFFVEFNTFINNLNNDKEENKNRQAYIRCLESLITCKRNINYILI